MSRGSIFAALAAAAVVIGWYVLGQQPAEQVTSAPAYAALPTPAELATMPDAQRSTLKTRLMSEAASLPDTVSDEQMDMTLQPVLSAAGEFSGADLVHRGSGAVKVYRLPDNSHVVRLENFRVTNGPALVVALAAHPDPGSNADVKKGYIRIGDLQANTGNQNYPVPAEFDVLSFGSVVIWCELFDVMFAAAPLQLY